MSRQPPSPTDYKLIFEDHRVGATIYDDLYLRFAANSGPVTKGGIDAVLETYRRAGRREVLEHIARRLNQANGVNDDATETSADE